MDIWLTLQENFWLIITALIVSALVTALVTPLIIRWYTKNNWLEQPEKRPLTKALKKTHQQSVPRGGGIALFIGLVVGALIFLHWDITIAAILGGASLLAFIGWLDDIYDVHPAIRLAVNLLAAVIVIASGVSIKFITDPFVDLSANVSSANFIFNAKNGILFINNWAGMLMTLFFIVWNINIINWSKGVDGQMPGFVAIAAIFIGILSLRFSADASGLVYNNTVLSFIVAGIFLGFLFWNFEPQKIMPGYGGGSLAGFLLSVIAILSGAKVATFLMVLAIPTADAIFTVARRILAGKSPFWGDRGHLHHKLLDELHWSKRQVAFFYWGVTLIMGLLSLVLNTQGKIIAILVCAISTFTFLVWVKIKSLRKSDQSMIE